MFITIDAPDSTGKTTLIEKLKDYFNEKNISDKFYFTRESSDKDSILKSLRELILNKENVSNQTRLFLLLAQREHHYINYIKPALDSNKIVICDRFVDSTIVYQGIIENESIEFINSIKNIHDRIITYPNITIYIKTSPEIILERMKNRTVNDPLDIMDINNIKKLTDSYEENFKKYFTSNRKLLVLNGNESVDDVFNELIIKLQDIKIF